MPDKFGFNRLGTEVRCIEDGCDAGGFVFQWPDKTRAKHHAKHASDLALAREKRQRKQAKQNLATINRERALERRVIG